MALYKEQIDRFGSAGANGASVEIRYTYTARNEAFHGGVDRIAKATFNRWQHLYARAVPKRTGVLAAGFKTRQPLKEYGKPVSVSTQSLQSFVPYARIVEAGGRGLRYKGTQRAGHQRRIWRKEVRLLRRATAALVRRIYGNR